MYSLIVIITYDKRLLKEKFTPERLLSLSSSTASKHSAFPLTEVSASEGPAILKKFVSKEATSEAAILKLSRVYVTPFRPTRYWRQGEKLATDLASFTMSAKSIFSKRLSTSFSLMLSFPSLG